jgi:IS605 OrfB family transposase
MPRDGKEDESVLKALTYRLYENPRHSRCAQQKLKTLHKQDRGLVDTYDTLVFEDLSSSTMRRRPKPKQDDDGTSLPNGGSRKAGLNTSINDAGWAMFQQLCVYKAEEAGRRVLFVNPHKTSQIGSACLQEGPHTEHKPATAVREPFVSTPYANPFVQRSRMQCW